MVAIDRPAQIPAQAEFQATQHDAEEISTFPRINMEDFPSWTFGKNIKDKSLSDA